MPRVLTHKRDNIDIAERLSSHRCCYSIVISGGNNCAVSYELTALREAMTANRENRVAAMQLVVAIREFQ